MLASVDSDNPEEGLLKSIAFNLDNTIAIAIQVEDLTLVGKEVNLVLSTGRSERANIGNDGLVLFNNIYVNEFYGVMTIKLEGEGIEYKYSLENYLFALQELNTEENPTDAAQAIVAALHNYTYYADQYVKLIRAAQ